MAVRTEAQREASRINGAKSRGPTSPEGKDRSRFNGLTHGLRAEEVVLPGEDAAEFEAERQAWVDDWKPTSHTRAVLCERAAVASWRLRRAVRAEAAKMATAAEDAAYAAEVERVARVDGAMARMADDPGGAVTLLGSTPEGLDRLIDRWAGLARVLEGGPSGWTGSGLHHGRLMRLLGRDPGDDPATVGPSAEASARLASANAPGARRPKSAEDDLACLRRAIEAELATLRARRAAMPTPEAERQRAIDVTLSDTSKEAQLRHRYEMAHERSLRGTVNQLMALAKSGADVERDQAEVVYTEDDTTESPETPPAPEPAAPGSVGAGDSPRPSGPPRAPSAVSNRDRRGRTWPAARHGAGRSSPSSL